MGYLLEVVLPWNRRSQTEYRREVPLSLTPSASSDYATWSATDGGYLLDMIMAGYKRELQLLNDSLSMISILARTHQRPTPFGLGTQFTAFITPQTQFKICLSKGSQILTQRLAKGKEKDRSDYPIFRWRRLALHQHQLIKIFTKGFASLGECAAI